MASHTLDSRGVSHFLELGPDGVLSAMTRECASALDDKSGVRESGVRATIAAAALRSGRSEPLTLLSALAELWAHGARVDWFAALGSVPSKLALPTYAFQRRRYWMEGSTGMPGRTTAEELKRSGTDDWRYRVEWKSIAAPAGRTLSGKWLVIVPAVPEHGQWTAALLDKLCASGEEVVPISLEATQATREHLRRHMDEALDASPGELAGVVSLLALDENALAAHEATPAGLAGTLALVQALEDLAWQAPLWLITRSAVAISAAERLEHPSQAHVWGLGRVVGLEKPTRSGGLIDLPESLDERTLGLLSGVLEGSGAEDQLALRVSGVYVRRLARPAGDASVDTEWVSPAGTTLITGGTGGLGAHVARWLAGQGAQHLLLVSRGGPDAPGADALAKQLRELGSEVTLAACDVADREQLSRLIGSLPEDTPLGAVIHAAGVGIHGALDSLRNEDLQEALAAKALGASNLDVLTRDLDLSAFVLFSSISGTLGSGEQAAYAAANAYLDALAISRHGFGLPASSIAWGPWSGAGMASSAEIDLGDALRRRGLEPMDPERAIAALRDSLPRGEANTVLADIRWETYAPLFASGGPRPLVEDLPEVQTALSGRGGASARAAGERVRQRLLEIPAEERREAALELVTVEVARVLGHGPGEWIDPNRPFKDLGFDSLLAIELRNRLDGVTGLELPATLVFDYPTPLAVADHVLAELAGEADWQDTSVEAELNRLERTLVSLRDPVERRGATVRLQMLLASLDGGDELSEEDGQSGQGGAEIAAQLQEVSDEELFGFIDQQLGAP